MFSLARRNSGNFINSSFFNTLKQRLKLLIFNELVYVVKRYIYIYNDITLQFKQPYVKKGITTPDRAIPKYFVLFLSYRILSDSFLAPLHFSFGVKFYNGILCRTPRPPLAFPLLSLCETRVLPRLHLPSTCSNKQDIVIIIAIPNATCFIFARKMASLNALLVSRTK